MKYMIQKPPHGSIEWLAVRWRDADNRPRISASIAAAVHNEHKYTSAADLAFELLSENPPLPKETNQAMDRGNRMEPMLLEWTKDLHKTNIYTPDTMYCYFDGRANLIATLDGITDDNKVFEIKTSRSLWTGVLPKMWYWQGVHQAICTGQSEINWVIFDSTLSMYEYVQFVSSDEMQTHIEACAVFLECIANGELPPNAVPNYENISNAYPTGSQSSVELPQEALGLIQQLEKTREVKKRAEDQEDTLKAEIGLLLQDADEGTINGSTVITWKNQNRESFDSKTFEKEHPALFAKFRKTSTFRIMRIKTKGSK